MSGRQQHEHVLKHIIPHAPAQGDAFRFVEAPVGAAVNSALPFSSSVWESDEKLRAMIGRTVPSLPRVMSLISSPKAPASWAHSKRFAKFRDLEHAATAFGVSGTCSRFCRRFMGAWPGSQAVVCFHRFAFQPSERTRVRRAFARELGHYLKLKEPANDNWHSSPGDPP